MRPPDYARRELFPLAPRMDNEEWWPAEAFAALGVAGYLGVTVPERYGGGGLDLFTSGLVLQGLARWNHALGLAWVAHDNLCVNNLYRNASEEACDSATSRGCARASMSAPSG